MDPRATTAPAPQTTLIGKRIRLEPLGTEHADELEPHAIDPALWTFTQQRLLSRLQLQENIRSALAERDKGLAVPFVVREIASGRAIGSTRYMSIDVQHRRLEIGWSWLGAAWHGTGINTEMKLLMLRHAFEELGFVRVEFKANAANARSRAALKKLGAREEGVFRKWRVGADGRTHDTAWYSIVDEEWPAVKARLESGAGTPPPRSLGAAAAPLDPASPGRISSSHPNSPAIRADESGPTCATRAQRLPLDRLLDLSHEIEHGMVTYQGLPAPLICDWLSREASRSRYEPGTEFQIGKIEMVANTGTYVDSPFHRYADGTDLAGLALDRLADLDCVVAHLDPPVGRAISRLPFTADEVRGRAVLVHTGWARHWRTESYFVGHPHLTGELAEWLVRAGAVLVGIDSFNIDCTDTGARPVHSALLRHDIPIVEHLCGLEAVPERGTRFFAVPPKVVGFGTFPVRAFVM